jgi:hypothetical protein|tara:strand:- start:581 stop:1447 length:867 start_codon:yes stop_codon:yes gene_type:complete
MTRTLNRLLTLSILSLALAVSSVSVLGVGKVLYVTHEPGQWHKYTPQLKAFKEQIAKKAGWDITIMTGDYDSLIEQLKKRNFAKGYDAIVYNYCLAKSNDLDAAANVMRQTRNGGVPAMLIHCSMHSWWDTYKTGEKGALGEKYKGKALATPELAKEWKAKNPDKRFPAYGDFTGVASVRHGKKLPITLHKVGDHPATKDLKDGYKTPNTELYNNEYVLKRVVPIIKGSQEGEKDAIVMWTCPQGKSQVMGLSIGHGAVGDGPDEWDTPEFQNLVINGVNYLIDNPKP